jgi:hypothetical protein
MSITFKPVTSVSSIAIHKFVQENTETMNKYMVQKKLKNLHNVFYYLKLVCEVLNSKTYDFKQNSSINADYFDLMFVMTKRINEAVVDAYNEYGKLCEKDGKEPL